MEQRVPRSHGVWRVEKALAGFRRSGDRAEQRPPRSRRLLGKPLVSSDELERVAREYRHIHEDHRRTPPRSRVRRRLDRKLRQVAQRFERLLAQAPISDADRQAWRAHLTGSIIRAPAPDVQALLFRGRSSLGSELRLTAGPGGTIAASINGTSAAVLDDADELTTTAPDFVFTLEGQRFGEIFGASPASLAELRKSLQEGRAPRREHLRELTGDGLVDRTGGLTARGRRALALDRNPARPAEPQPRLMIRTQGHIPSRSREHLAQSLTHVASLSPRPVIGITASLTRSADRALPRPVVAKATIAVTGDRVRAAAEAATAGEAVNLLEFRLHRNLRKLGGRELADRRSASHAE